MSLIKVQHDKNNPYLTINTTIAVDSRLSYKAKGIWFYAFSRKEDWQFYKNDLLKRSTDGERSLDAGLKELEDAGYFIKFRSQDEKTGQFKGWEWVFFETPKTQEEIQKMFPKGTFCQDRIMPESAEPPPIVSNDFVLNNENNNKATYQKSDLSNKSVVVDSSKELKREMYKCLYDLPFEDSFREKVIWLKKNDGNYYTPNEIERAVNFTKGKSYDCLEAFFTDVLKNPDKYKDAPTKEDKEQKVEQGKQALAKLIEERRKRVIDFLKEYPNKNIDIYQDRAVATVLRNKTKSYFILSFNDKDFEELFFHLKCVKQ